MSAKGPNNLFKSVRNGAFSLGVFAVVTAASLLSLAVMQLLPIKPRLRRAHYQP